MVREAFSLRGNDGEGQKPHPQEEQQGDDFPPSAEGK